MPLFERPQEPRPESQREREDRLIAKLVRMEHEARRHASDDWDVQPQPKDVPYPFIFEPHSGWLNWGTQGGVHDEIVNNLYRTGERVPNGSFFGRWYPHSDHVEFYDPQYFELPYRQQQQHQETILRNAPGRPQKASGGDAWSGLGLGDQDDWKVASAPMDEDDDSPVWSAPGEKHHDYHPFDGYEPVQPGPIEQEAAIEAAQRAYQETGIPFEIYFVTGIEPLGIFVNGTESYPTILINDDAAQRFLDPEQFIYDTIRHELQHALQAQRGEEMDEDDAEHGWR